jgi:hypothetical protein
MPLYALAALACSKFGESLVRISISEIRVQWRRLGSRHSTEQHDGDWPS